MMTRVETPLDILEDIFNYLPKKVQGFFSERNLDPRNQKHDIPQDQIQALKLLSEYDDDLQCFCEDADIYEYARLYLIAVIEYNVEER